MTRKVGLLPTIELMDDTQFSLMNMILCKTDCPTWSNPAKIRIENKLHGQEHGSPEKKKPLIDKLPYCTKLLRIYLRYLWYCNPTSTNKGPEMIVTTSGHLTINQLLGFICTVQNFGRKALLLMAAHEISARNGAITLRLKWNSIRRTRTLYCRHRALLIHVSWQWSVPFRMVGTPYGQ